MGKIDNIASFALRPAFVEEYQKVQPPFGFNALGEFVYITRYARVLPDGSREKWYQTVERVVNGTIRMQERWIKSQGLPWDVEGAMETAQRMYDAIFHMRFLPPGRGLWAMGTEMTETRHIYASLNNCGFVSTADMAKDPSKPFVFLMDAAMLGVGVGFDTEGAGSVVIKGAKEVCKTSGEFVIPDSREGWVESVKLLLDAHFHGTPLPALDYSDIRPRNTPIRGFGGNASGPDVLKRLHMDIQGVMEKLRGKPITVTAICDIMNQIGRCIVSGDARQTAEIAFGRLDDTPENFTEYLHLKDYDKNPERAEWGWTSNNSVIAPLGSDYSRLPPLIAKNGEPGLAWIENMQNYGRMGDPPNYKDIRATGGNPCLEQTLESYELCCLVETFPVRNKDFEQFKETLELAFLYAKTVTLGATHWPETNEVLLRNRRIGCSMSGIAQFIAKNGIHELKEWCDKGYNFLQEVDKAVSEKFAIPLSIKTTSIKPSGTVSLVAGASPGMHFPEGQYYIRRVRIRKGHELTPTLKAAGYIVEPAVEDPENKDVISFPVNVGELKEDGNQLCNLRIRTLDDVSMWEQLSLAAFLQKYWADNQVSCTVTFKKEEEKDLLSAIDMYQYQLKGVSFLPRLPKLAYPQLPYEVITEEEYNELASRLKPISFSTVDTQTMESTPDMFCDSDVCEIKPRVKAVQP